MKNKKTSFKKSPGAQIIFIALILFLFYIGFFEDLLSQPI